MTAESPPKEDIETVGAAGWVEVIVKDKHGQIKYRFPEKEAEKEEDCALSPFNNDLFPSFPSKLPEYYYRKNIVTDVGLAAVIRLIFEGLTETKFSHIAIGTGTTTETAADTALVTEIKRKPASITQLTTTITGDTARLEAEFSSADGLTGTATIAETGIFNATTGGILLARKTFPGITLNWDLGDSILIRYFIQMIRA
jgi:hypothetical protein